MKVYKCNCLPDGLEFGGICVANSEDEARKELRKMAENGGWIVTEQEIELEEIDTTKPGAVVVDPGTHY